MFTGFMDPSCLLNLTALLTYIYIYIYIPHLVVSRTSKMPYLTLDDQTWAWVTNVFKAHLMEDTNKELFVILNTKIVMPADQYFSMFHEVIIELPQRSFAAPSQMAKHSVLLMCHSTAGAHLWWSAPCFLTIWGLVPEKSTVGRAIHNHRWERWVKLVPISGLDERCLRKPAVTQHDSSETSNKERVWNVPSVTTHMILRLLCRWAFAKEKCGALGTSKQRQSSKDALECLLQVFKGHSSMMLVSPKAVWEPPRRPSADDGVLINCASHKVDFQALLAAFPQWQALKVCKKAAAFKWEKNGEVDILVLLQAASEAGRHAECLLNQLVWGLGSAIEDVLMPELLQRLAAEEPEIGNELEKQLDETMSGEGVSPASSHPNEQSGISHTSNQQQPAISLITNPASSQLDHKRKSSAAAFRTQASPDGLVNSAHRLTQFLDSYHRGAYELFHDEKQLSISIDGARMARKALLLAAVAKPTGEAAWAPPQISTDYSGEASLSILEGDDEEKDVEAAKEAQNHYTGIGGPTQVSKASGKVSCEGFFPGPFP